MNGKKVSTSAEEIFFCGGAVGFFLMEGIDGGIIPAWIGWIYCVAIAIATTFGIHLARRKFRGESPDGWPLAVFAFCAGWIIIASRAL
jgi:hypothetical protein